MEVVGFAQRLPLASTASLWALLVIHSMEDLWMQTSENKLSVGATAHGHVK